ncbi:MAG: hypothetical protein P8X39_03160 [Desulfofustis sp.]
MTILVAALPLLQEKVHRFDETGTIGELLTSGTLPLSRNITRALALPLPVRPKHLAGIHTVLLFVFINVVRRFQIFLVADVLTPTIISDKYHATIFTGYQFASHAHIVPRYWFVLFLSGIYPLSLPPFILLIKCW